MQLANLIILLALAPAIPLCAHPPAALPPTPPAATVNPSRFLVTILPVQVAGNGMPAWIGRSVQQSLQAEVSVAGYVLYSALSQSVDNPAQFEQQYRDIYDQRPVRDGYRGFEYYPAAYIGYPGINPYGFYGPGYTIICRSTQYFPPIGLGFNFGYGNSNLQLPVQGGLGENTTTGSTIIIGGP